MKILHILGIIGGFLGIILGIITKDFDYTMLAFGCFAWASTSFMWYCSYLEEKYKNENK